MLRSTRRGTRQSRRPMKRMRTPRSFMSSRWRLRIALVEAHEVADLVAGARPVLGRERVDRHPVETEVETALDGVEQRFLAGGVALGALEAAALRPTGRCRPSPAPRAWGRGRVDAGHVHRRTLPPATARPGSAWRTDRSAAGSARVERWRRCAAGAAHLPSRGDRARAGRAGGDRPDGPQLSVLLGAAAQRRSCGPT